MSAAQSRSQDLRVGVVMVRKGSNGCVRAMVNERPSQNQKKKARADNTGGSKTVCNCTKDDLDTGEWLPINTFLSFLPLSISFFATCLSATCHLPAPRHVLLTPPQWQGALGVN